VKKSALTYIVAVILMLADAVELASVVIRHRTTP
jgi:hypothetical protein